ncbi:MAG: hypothetical protein RIE84_14290 [Parvibaculum sp.]|jgi:hypothetical protein|uniref:hypothetical protein n=1 Tax=Parvibaculum sp. TaxID=2024848 RepID=UPI0032ED08DB
MRYLNLIGGLLVAAILAGCETAQIDRYLTPELGTAIGGLIGAKITGTTYNGPIPVPLPGRSGSGAPSQAGYGGAGAAAQAQGGMPNTPECQAYMQYAMGPYSPSKSHSGLMQMYQRCVQSGSRQAAGCPSGYYSNGQSCAPLSAGAELCGIGGYCPQGTRCRPDGGCDAITDSGKKLEDILEELDKGTRSKEQLEVLERVNRDLDEHRASGQKAPDGQGAETAGTQPPSGSSQSGAPAQTATPQTAQDNPADTVSSEPFTGEMTHPVYKNTSVIGDGQTAQPASGGSAASPSKSGNTTSFVQDWLDGKPVDPVKLSPDARRKYYEQKAKAEAAARVEAARQGQAEERAYQTTFGRASRYNTAGETESPTPARTTPAPVGAPAAEDDPGFVDMLSHTPLRADADLTPPIGQQQEEPPSYK